MLPRNVKLKYLVNGRSYLVKIIEDYKNIVASKLADVYVF